MIEKLIIFVGCQTCPYAYRSHYRTYLYCPFNPTLNRGTDKEHDLTDLEEYPKYCPL